MGSCVSCGKKIPLFRMQCDTCKAENVLTAEPKTPKRPIREPDDD